MLLIVNNTNADVILANSPENLYNSMYQLFSDENFTAVLEKIDTLILSIRKRFSSSSY
jgi:hypothetical protein